MTKEAADEARSIPQRLPPQVLALGWVSLLTDAASDMIYPLLPAFLMSLGGGATALGWVEGVAEGVSAIVKLASGRASDRSGKRKRLVALGYGVSSLARPFFALATAPWHAVLVRVADRVGKGVRGPPRDAILASAVGASQRGHAFGFHRMMDNFGGVLGPALAFLLLRLFEIPLRTMFVLSIFPGALAVLTILLFVKEPVTPKPSEPPAPAAEAEALAVPAATLPAGAVRYLAVLGVFALASSGDLFLMRRLTNLGMALPLVPLAWVSLNLGKGLLNVPGGRASGSLRAPPRARRGVGPLRRDVRRLRARDELARGVDAHRRLRRALRARRGRSARAAGRVRGAGDARTGVRDAARNRGDHGATGQRGVRLGLRRRGRPRGVRGRRRESRSSRRSA